MVNVELCNQNKSISICSNMSTRGMIVSHLISTSHIIMKKGFRPEMRSKCIMIVGRYPSACEAALRILGFEIQYREPAVVRLPFHLPNSQPVTFKDSDTLEGAINKPSTHSFMFLAWFKSNK